MGCLPRASSATPTRCHQVVCSEALLYAGLYVQWDVCVSESQVFLVFFERENCSSRDSGCLFLRMLSVLIPKMFVNQLLGSLMRARGSEAVRTSSWTLMSSSGTLEADLTPPWNELNFSLK
jgi:hypothetical protein